MRKSFIVCIVNKYIKVLFKEGWFKQRQWVGDCKLVMFETFQFI